MTMDTLTLASTVDAAFERRAEISPNVVPADLANALGQVIDALNRGVIRVAEKVD